MDKTKSMSFPPLYPFLAPAPENRSRKKIPETILEKSTPAESNDTGSLDFWKKYLQNAPAALDLPADHRPASPSFSSAVHSFAIPAFWAGQLELACQKKTIPEQAWYLSIFQLLVFRQTQQEDFTVGFHSINGASSLWLPLRSTICATDLFLFLAQKTENLLKEAEAHASLSASFFTEQLGSDPSTLFQVAFSPVFSDLPSPGIDLCLQIQKQNQETIARFVYNASRFNPSTLERMAGHFIKLLESSLTQEKNSLATLPWLTSREQKQLREWNQTNDIPPDPRSIHQLFEEQVERTPHDCAIIDGEHRLTYSEANQKANQLARQILSLSIPPESLIGVCLNRTSNLVIALLAILKSGNAYVPLDINYPADRLAFMLQDSQAAVILTEESLLGRLPESSAHIICLDRESTAIDQHPKNNPSVPTHPHQLAYVIYTSGSTGRPKGVAIEHHSTVTLIQWAQTILSREDLSGMLFCTSICFDLSVFEVFLTLAVGGRLIVAHDALQLASLPAKNEVTVINTVPSALASLLTMKAIPESVQIVCLAGEPLPGMLAEKIYRLPHIKKLFNLYGPTEDTTYSTWSLVPKETGVRPTIGRPISRSQLYILDSNFQPVPIGIPGEIYLGGDGLAREYLHRPDLTAEKFIRNPLPDTPGARLYKTGDLARYLPNGEVDYLGRIDFQVKIRGFRIELDEIQSVLNRHPHVQESVVVAREESSGEKRVVAYVVPKKPNSPVTSDLRHWVQKKLPDYMVPSAFVLLDSLPLTPNGKVDRRALPAPQASRENFEKDYVSPQNPLELQLVEIWEELLNIRPIGIRDNFFDLGGHSLLAVKMLDQVRTKTGNSLPFSILFSGATIEYLASTLREKRGQAHLTGIVEVQKGDPRELPFFFLHGDYEGGGFYCANLARWMGPNRPFYALEPHGMNSDFIPDSIEAMAEDHLKRLLKVRPEGPYCLGGHCNGALIAFEMAQRLILQGHHVSYLAMIDPSPADYQSILATINFLAPLLGWNREKKSDHLLYWRDKADRLKKWSRLPGPEQIKVAGRKFRELLHGDYSGISPHSRRAPQTKIEAMNQSYDRSMGLYLPSFYPGFLHLIFSGEKPSRGFDSSLGWEKMARNIEIEWIPGGHLSLLTRHLPALASSLGASLGKTLQEEASHKKRVRRPAFMSLYTFFS